jgi:hypothetical protein
MSRKRRFLTGLAKRQRSESGDGKKGTRSNRRNTDRSSPSGTRAIGANGSHISTGLAVLLLGVVWFVFFRTWLIGGRHALAQSA